LRQGLRFNESQLKGQELRRINTIFKALGLKECFPKNKMGKTFRAWRKN